MIFFSKQFYLMILLSVVFVSTAFSQEDSVHVQFEYWNDNFLFQDFINDVFPGTPVPETDDHVTAGFSLKAACGKVFTDWTLEIDYAILTNKSDRYRADLLSFAFVKRNQYPLGLIHTGIGIVGRGNYGGRTIQNGYHNLFHYPKVTIPYLNDSKAGILASLQIETNLFHKSRWTLSHYLGGHFVSAAGPSKVSTGFRFQPWKPPETAKHPFSLKIDVGYKYYFKTDRWLDPLFDRGVKWEILLAKTFRQKWHTAFWITKGQYGIEDEWHFGCVLGVGCDHSSFIGHPDIDFP